MAVRDLSVVRQKARVTAVAAVVNFFLAGGKVAVGVVGQSTSLVADGIHSFSDLASDLFILLTIKLSSKGVDKEHPYGHGRFETVATAVLGAMLVAVAGGIGWDAAERLRFPEQRFQPGVLALAAAAVSILANELLFHYSRYVGRRTRSKLMLANAWHHRSDAISSVIVVVGVAGTMWGYSYADAVAAILVGLMVAKIGIDLVWDSTRELVDTSLPAARIREIRQAILTTDGVEALHMLRTRQMGADALVDVHIIVNPRISVSEGHLISDAVRYRLLAQFEEITDVLVHVDSEDDEVQAWNATLPLRGELMASVWSCWEGIAIADEIQKVNLHYLQGQVELEVLLPRAVIDDANTPDRIERQFAIAKQLDFVSGVRVYYTDHPGRSS